MGRKGATGCQGDSGGPLFMRESGEESPWYQIGIVSFGSQGCARSDDPTVYTRVSAYANWIYSKMKSGEPATTTEQQEEGVSNGRHHLNTSLSFYLVTYLP